MSQYIFSENCMYWREDQEFLSKYRSICKNDQSADRKFLCGAYEGCSSYFICQKIQGTGRQHYIFDSWEGLSQPGKMDGEHWEFGSLTTSEEITKKALQEFNFVHFYKGWIPDRFKKVDDRKFSFVHIDVDLYEPTKLSLEFFYPKVQTGGIILCDDYGSTLCPGANQAFNEFFMDKSEKVIHAPTSQGFIIKK